MDRLDSKISTLFKLYLSYLVLVFCIKGQTSMYLISQKNNIWLIIKINI